MASQEDEALKKGGDVNNVQVPYAYAEYPRQLHKANNETLTVNSDDDKEKALSDGWSLEPVLTDEQKKAVAAATQREKSAKADEKAAEKAAAKPGHR